MKNRSIALLLVAGVLGSGCTSLSNRASAVFFPARADTEKTRGEIVTVDLTQPHPIPPRPPRKGQTKAEVAAAQAAGALGAMAAEIVLEQVTKFLEEESERYTATYSGIAVADDFYAGWTVDAPLNLTGITLTRSALVDDSRTTAATIGFEVKGTRDLTAFEIKPVSARVDYAKAKIARFGLLDPGSWFEDADDTIDLSVQLTMHAVWTDAEAESHIKKVFEGSLKIQDLKIGTAYGPGAGAPVPGGSFVGQLTPAIPRSFLGDGSGGPIYGTGNFIISILVTEHDDYGSKVKQVGTALSENQDKIIGYIAKQ